MRVRVGSGGDRRALSDRRVVVSGEGGGQNHSWEGSWAGPTGNQARTCRPETVERWERTKLSSRNVDQWVLVWL